MRPVFAALDSLGMLRLRRAGVQLHVDGTARLHARKIQPQRECSLSLGPGSILEAGVTFERPRAVVKIGARTFVNGFLAAAERIVIGDDVLVAWGVTIVDHDSHAVAFSRRSHDVEQWGRGVKDWSSVRVQPVTIEHKAWIGMHAILLRGVTIGEGAIVGAGAVVTHDVAPWTVVGGNPAKSIRVLGVDER